MSDKTAPTIASLLSEIDDLKRQVAHLAARQAAEPVVPIREVLNRAYGEKLARKTQRQAQLQKEQLARLEEGPQKFRVSLPGNPPRTVGAADSHTAQEKYRQHFGIRATVNEYSVVAEE